MAVPWAPTLEQVAVYVPWLTVNTKVPGSQAYLMTFDANTSPDATVAGWHVTDAITLIGSAIATMPSGLYDLAATTAAKYAAATLAAAYARTDEDRVRAAALATLSAAAWKSLLDAADNQSAATLSALPVLIAPAPVPWGDSYL